MYWKCQDIHCVKNCEKVLIPFEKISFKDDPSKNNRVRLEFYLN